MADALAKRGDDEKASEYRARAAMIRQHGVAESGVDLEVQLSWQAETANLQQDFSLVATLLEDLVELRRKTYGDQSEEGLPKLAGLVNHRSVLSELPWRSISAIGGLAFQFTTGSRAAPAPGASRFGTVLCARLVRRYQVDERTAIRDN